MNMREIARRAGVSSATVSRVINGSTAVQEQTAKRVQQVLDSVNFIPNPVATTLKYGRSKTFGLIIPDIANPFFAEFLGAFEDLLAETGHEVLLTNVQSEEKLLAAVRRMLMRQVDGAVMMSSEYDTQSVERLLRHRVPLVTIDRRTVQAGCSDVGIAYEDGFLQAALHLKSLGHKRIGFIGGTAGLLTSEIRLHAFQAALEQAGLRFSSSLVRAGNYRISGGEAGIRALLQLRLPPTAVLTANDLTAFGVVREARAAGRRVPDDLSVVGLDDLLLSDVLHPPLTTIRIPRRRMAEICIDALNYTKEDVDRVGKLYSVPVELIVRQSTAAPAGKGQRQTAR